MRKLTINLRPGQYSVVRLPTGAPLPAMLLTGTEHDALVSITRNADEWSVVCPADNAPVAELVERDWRLLTVRGPFEFTLTGIMAALAGALAAAGVPLFAVSTYDTDHVLVKAADLDRAVVALRDAGHEVTAVDV